METREIFNMFLARRENYNVSSVARERGGYSITMEGQNYNAVVLSSSFDYYEKRYHLAKKQPSLIICLIHDTVVPCAVLSLKVGNFAQPFDLPAVIENIEFDRKSKTGARVLLGMYLSGLRNAHTIIDDLPDTSRKRYMARAKELSKRRAGHPVGTPVKEKTS
jgi:hypothetical protein